MEPLKLPLPSLQFLAGHAVGRCLVLMKIDKAYWDTNHEDTLRQCELKVDKLPLPPASRAYVSNMLRGFFEQVKEWISVNSVANPGADILVDARGNIDEKRMIRHHFEKRYKGEFYREDFKDFARFLEHLYWFNPVYSRDFVRIIVKLQKVDSSLVGPDYRLVGDDLQVVFRFLNRHCAPSAFNTLVEWKRYPLSISMEQKDFLVTYRLSTFYHDEDMFRSHVDLLQPSQRLEFVKRVLDGKFRLGLVHQVIRFLNVLDPEMRRNSVLGLKEDFAAFRFLECCLIPGYESLFIPMMKLIGLNLDRENYFRLFHDLVKKVDLIGYDSLLLQFWKHLPATKKAMFHTALECHNAEGHNYIKWTMKTLSRANTELFQVLFDNMSASLTKKTIRHAR